MSTVIKYSLISLFQLSAREMYMNEDPAFSRRYLHLIITGVSYNKEQQGESKFLLKVIIKR